ncbi:MAG: Gfo/Idh/MocA family oxidoreductase [Chryseolinea sp.]
MRKVVSRNLRFAVFGTGFWSTFQIAAWKELEGVELIAVYNRTSAKAEEIAHRFDIPRVYDNAQTLLDNEDVDFIDIITDVDTHAVFTMMAAQRGVHVICQKPMAPSLTVAESMVAECRKAKASFYIHENWRWQAPIRKVKQILDSNTIGTPFKARVTFCSAFPVFENQPFLKTLEEFIITDIGSHILDTCRFLFGEVNALWCHTTTVNAAIKGEDVANVMMKMKNGMTCYAEMSYASILEHESFPETFILIEGTHGSIHLTRDCQIRTTTREATEITEERPKQYPWLDPKYALVHASIVDCNRNILEGLQGNKAETTGQDNLETVRLVNAAYSSSRKKEIVYID